MFGDPIYKRDANGNIRIWQYEVEGAQWRTHSGLRDGQIVVTGWTTCTPKSQDTAEAQALFEAEAEMKKKLDRDYRRTIEDVDRPRASVVKPMLAHKYEGWTGGAWSQPKLDGIRCIATKDGLWSRQGKPIVACPHIVEALAPLFVLHPGLILDGELYNHALKDDFNQITSLVKRLKPTAEDLAKSADLIQYHVYDVPSFEQEFGLRVRFLQHELGLGGEGVIRLVETKWAATEVALDALYSDYLELGYEGQMVRSNGRYEQKRSKHLLKRKEFQDAEYKVLRIEEGNGNWAGYAKRIVCQLDDGREFGAGVKGNQDFCKQLLGQTPEQATIRFFALTPDGVPRFPVAVAFHEGERL